MRSRMLGLVAGAMLAVVLAGCAATSGSGPSELNPAQPPGSTGGTVRHGGSPAPDAATRRAVIAALKADGIEVTDGPGIVMTYSADRQTIAVNGPMSRGGQEATGGAPGTGSVGAVVVENKNGTWAVVK